MKKIYRVENDYIVVHDTTNFIPRHILDCGQVFRYEKVGNLYKIISNNRFCTLINNEDYVIIKCKDIEYFIKYFDLDRDYSAICDKLTRLGLQKETEFGRGIRILNQDKFEMIISFIISANNHIPRIKAIIERLCKSYGENMTLFLLHKLWQKQRSPNFVCWALGIGLNISWIQRKESAKWITLTSLKN